MPYCSYLGLAGVLSNRRFAQRKVLHLLLQQPRAIGLSDDMTVVVSDAFSAVGDVGRLVYSLHGRELRPRPGTVLPSSSHVMWHRDEVFKGRPLAA